MRIPTQIEKTLAADPLLRPSILEWPGLRVPGAWDGFELATRAILGQQVSVKAARTPGRAPGLGLGGSDSTRRRYPSSPISSRSLTGSPRADVASIGLPKTRATTLRRLARAVAGGEPNRGSGASNRGTRASSHHGFRGSGGIEPRAGRAVHRSHLSALMPHPRTGPKSYSAGSVKRSAKGPEVAATKSLTLKSWRSKTPSTKPASSMSGHEVTYSKPLAAVGDAVAEVRWALDLEKYITP